LSTWGGPSDAIVGETGLQEFTSDDECILQWWALDHFDIGDFDDQGASLTDNNIRFPHMNAIDIDDDNNIIFSNHNLSEITKIERGTGDIIWRLGGVHSDFTFANDPLNGQTNQHAISALGGGLYLMFDNGDGHNPQVSRAVKYQIDTNAMTATMVWEYREYGWYSHHMSNAQQLPNGNVLINWGQRDLPKLTEIRPDGSIAFWMDFVYPSECYRVHRCPWNGMVEVPFLDYEVQNDNVTLLFNKFGDPDVDYYKIYYGTSQNPTTLLDTSRTTLKKIYNLENVYYWFRVTSVNHSGQESGYSNQESILVNLQNPTENLVDNGDFSNGEENWFLGVYGSGQAEWSVEDGVAIIDVIDGGDYDWEVMLIQNGITLIQGNTYIFEFDASADATRLIGAYIQQDQSPWINYSKTTYSQLNPVTTHFSYEFEMEDPSDFNARVVFDMAQSNINVYLDNVSIKLLDTRVSDEVEAVPVGWALDPAYPNPFNPETRIEYQMPKESHVSLRVYSVLGRLVRTLVNEKQVRGHHQVIWDGLNDQGIREASGLYLVSMQAGVFKEVQKITLLK